jgi:hypothetical protein
VVDSPFHNNNSTTATAGTASPVALVYDKLAFPLRTEMAYQLDHDSTTKRQLSNTLSTNKEVFAFIVALSLEKLEYRPYKLKFLSGLAVAIFVAAFDLEEEERERSQSVEKEKELDIKEFFPVRPHNSSAANLPSLALAPGHLSVPVLDFSKLSEGGPASRRGSYSSEEVNNIATSTGNMNIHNSSSTGNIRRTSLDHLSGGLPPVNEQTTPSMVRRKSSSSYHSMVGLDLSQSDAHHQMSTVTPASSGSGTSSNTNYNYNNNINNNNNNQNIHPNPSPNNNPIPVRDPSSSATLAITLSSPRGSARDHVPPLEDRLQLDTTINSTPTPRDVLDECLPTPRSMISVASRTDLQTGGAIVPAWTPPTDFSFPIFEIPVKHHPLPNDLTMESFSEVKHIADGSNSNIFLGKLPGEGRVVVKMIKQSAENDPIAIQEFDLEYGKRIVHFSSSFLLF